MKRFLTEVLAGVVPETIWTYQEVGHNQAAKQHLKEILPYEEELFITPKPEGLIERIFTISTVKDDLVVDSFAGSGTTGAVAHKMGRRWIMVELGDHCHTHIVPRLRKVIGGTDLGGITEAAKWTGGGGFRYYYLAPSLMEKDAFDQWVISKEYNGPMLAEAVCKLMGYTYAPNDRHYWMQGQSSERDFIYVTTNSLTHAQLRAISEDVGPDRSLLICCKAFRGNADVYENLTVKRIPQAVLHKCEWGKDDYSMQIENLPAAPKEPVSSERAQTDLFTERG